MAIAVVDNKHGPGAGAATLEIPSATAGEVLVAFVHQLASGSEPKGKDNIGTAGWVTNATKAFAHASADSLWVMMKVAVGGEKLLEPTAGAGGTVTGIQYFKLTGASTTVDEIVATSNTASVVEVASPGLTTTDAGDVILAAVGLNGASGVVGAWTSSGTALTAGEAGTTRCFGGSKIPGATLAGETHTAHWATGRFVGMLVVAIKPAAAGVAVPLAAASSSSAASLGVTAPTQVPLEAGSSLSAAQLAVTASTQIPLAAASSLSADQLAVTAPTAVPLAAAASLSAGSLSVTTPGAAAVIPLAPASSTSAGAATVNVPGAVLIGEEGTQPNGVAASLGRLVAGQFTALSTGIVHELWVWLEKTATAKVKLGLMSESAGLPGAVLGKGLVTGQAPEPGWVKLVGLSIAVTAGTKYWLVVTRTNGAFVVAAHGPAGTPVVQSVGEPGEIEATSWQEPQEQGPLRFVARGVAVPLVELAPGSSSSGGSAALNAPTQVVLGAGGSLSAAQLAVLARTQVPLAPGVSTASGLLTLSTRTPIALAPAVGESTGQLAVSVSAVAPAEFAGGGGATVAMWTGGGSSPGSTVGSGGAMQAITATGGTSS